MKLTKARIHKLFVINNQSRKKHNILSFNKKNITISKTNKQFNLRNKTIKRFL